MRVIKALDLVPERVDLLLAVGLDLGEGRELVDELAVFENRDHELFCFEVIDGFALPRRLWVEDLDVLRIVDRLVKHAQIVCDRLPVSFPKKR